MRIVIITQNDPFYLAENLDYLFRKLPRHSRVVGCILLDPSPFGKKGTFFEKMLRTINVFGIGFFVRYGLQYLINRPNPNKSVPKVLKKRGIPMVELTKSINHHESLALIERFSPEILVSIAGNQIFKSQLIALAPKGCLNLHTALLPKYRGLMPSFWVLRNGEKYTGVSVFFVNDRIDSGPVIVQKRVEIGNHTQKELIIQTKKLGMDAISEAIDFIEAGRYELVANEDAASSYFSFPSRRDVLEFKRAGKRFY